MSASTRLGRPPAARLEESPPSPSRAAPPDGPLELIGLECSLDTVPLDTLEKVACEVTPSAVFARFDEVPMTAEAALLTTCHRVELMLLVPHVRVADRWAQSLPGPAAAWRRRTGRDAVHHLFRVAAGLESLARGEVEVREQVRSAAAASLSRRTRPALRETFRAAVRSAEAAVPPPAGRVSFASVTVEALRPLLPGPRPEIVIVGCGAVGRRIAEELASTARITLVYHARPPPPHLRNASGIRTVPLTSLASVVPGADVVITAAKFGDRGLRPADLPGDRPRLLVDLGLPRNIDPAVAILPGVRLIDLQALRTMVRAVPVRSPIDRGVEARALRFSERLEGRLRAPQVDALLRDAEETRRQELGTAERFLGPLSPAQRLAVDRLTRRLVARLLLPSIERLRDLPAGVEGDRARTTALAILGAERDGP